MSGAERPVLVLGRVEPLRLRSLSEEDMAELRAALAKGSIGPIVMVPPEPGPIELKELVEHLERRVYEAGQGRAELVRQVAELQRECDRLADQARVTREAFQTPLPLDAWHEGIGPVLWWLFPVEEAPWCGSPGDSDWPGYHTHWTPLPGVAQPDGAPAQPTPMRGLR